MNYQKTRISKNVFFTDRYIFDEDKPSTVDNQEIENLTTKNITIQNKKKFHEKYLRNYEQKFNY